DQGVVGCDGDASEVLGVQTTLVGQGADDGTWADVLALAHRDAVGGQVCVVTVEAGRTVTTVTPVAATATTVVEVAVTTSIAAVSAVTVPATVAVSGLLGQEEVVAGLSLGGQCGGDVLEGYVVLVGVLLDQSAEESDLG